MPLKLQSSSGGSVTLDVPVTSNNYTVTVPNATGTAMVSGNMPIFSVYLGSQQSITTQTYTKLNFDTKEYDTANCFNTSTYRFTPNVAGYYQFNVQVDNSTGSPSRMFLDLYKNGSVTKIGLDIGISTGNFNQAAGCVLNAMSYANGTTDYFEVYFWCNGGATINQGSSGTQCYFQGYLVRAA